MVEKYGDDSSDNGKLFFLFPSKPHPDDVCGRLLTWAISNFSRERILLLLCGFSLKTVLFIYLFRRRRERVGSCCNGCRPPGGHTTTEGGG